MEHSKIAATLLEEYVRQSQLLEEAKYTRALLKDTELTSLAQDIFNSTDTFNIFQIPIKTDTTTLDILRELDGNVVKLCGSLSILEKELKQYVHLLPDMPERIFELDEETEEYCKYLHYYFI